jgi:methylglutaconyl-CoA hydratase
VLRVERDASVLRITLERPDLVADLVFALLRALRDVGDARAVVLSSAAPEFCIGADVAWFENAATAPQEENAANIVAVADLLRAIEQCPAPVVARVHGDAIGGGAGIVAAADLAIASPAARFAIREVTLGILPAVISPYLLAKLSPAAARRFVVTGERFGAQAALWSGLISEVADDVDSAVDRVVDALHGGGPDAVRSAKRLVRDRPTGTALAEMATARAVSEEGREGLAALVERRTPAWARR